MYKKFDNYDNAENARSIHGDDLKTLIEIPEDELSETQKLKLDWMVGFDLDHLDNDDRHDIHDVLTDDLFRIVGELDNKHEKLDSRVDEIDEALENSDELLFDVKDKVDLHKAAIIGLFGAQILLSVLYFCSRHKMGSSIHGMKDRKV